MPRFLCFFVCCLTAASAAAQVPQRQRPEKWEVSLRAGGALSSDKRFATAVDDGTTKTVGLDFDTGAAFAFGVTDNVSPHLGFELEYAVSLHKSSFSNLSSSLPILGLDQYIHRFTYNAIVYPLDRHGKVRPYLVGGAGASYFQTSVNELTTSLQNGVDFKDRWQFTYDYGGGVKVMLNQQWGLRFDLRNYTATVPDYGLPRVAPVVDGQPGLGFRADGTLQSWQFGAGFNYVFKRR